MIRLAHLSDLHVTEGPRLDDEADTLGRAVDQIIASRPDLVAITGDTFGHAVPYRSTPRERLVVFDAVERLAQVAPVVYIMGNHDWPDDLELLAKVATGPNMPAVRVVSRPTPFEVWTPNGTIRVYPLPYFRRRAFLDVRGTDVPPTAAEVVAASNEAVRSLLLSWRGRVQRARAADPDAVCVFLGHVQVGGAVVGGGEQFAASEIEVDASDLAACGFDYAGIGHIHRRQRLADRSWYVGSLWPTTHGRARQSYGWHLVEVGGAEALRSLHDRKVGIEVAAEVAADVLDGYAEHRTRLAHVDAHPRRLVTLDYRYATVGDDPVPRWVREPTPNELREVAGAEVRPVLVVPAQFATVVPWGNVIAQLRELGAVRIHPSPEVGEIQVEPVHRVRDGAEAVAAAVTLPDQVGAWLATLESAPSDADRAALFDFLGELDTDDDEAIDARTDALADIG